MTTKEIGERLYEDAKNRHKQYELIEKYVNYKLFQKISDIKKNSSKIHLNQSSHKQAHDRLIKMLTKVIESFNNPLTFEELGQYLQSIGIYRILFNPAYSITITPEGNLNNIDSPY